MAIDVQVSGHIARPPEQVAGFAMEAENDTRWIGGISSARRLTSGPTSVGTRVERVASFMGKRIDYVMDVMELESNRRIVLRSVKSPFPMKVTYGFEGDGSGTTVTLRVEGEPAGFYKLAGGLMAPSVRKNLAADLKRLKNILETETGSSDPTALT